MEEVKVSDSSSITVPTNQVYTWFWQSDPDPWKEPDNTKWSWTPYQNDVCNRIEEAFLLKKTTVDIGSYEIDFDRMRQIHKKQKNKMRRIKRELNLELDNRFLTELPMPSEQDEKTLNEAFGNVQHFLDYMMNRTPAAFKLYERLKNLSLCCQESEYLDIIEEVIDCIKRSAEEREIVIKTRDPNSSHSCIRDIEKIVNLVRPGSSKSLKEFLESILKIYTMESFVCYSINELLRNEKWEELNSLSPYIVCLVYAFQIQDYVIKLSRSITDYFLRLINMNTLDLYRGAALTEEHLGYYKAMKGKHFSWNAVTSTSRRREVAEIFVNLSLRKALFLKEKKVGVIFEIQADFSSLKDCVGMIDVSSYSRFPHEKEVILAPGTVFKLNSIKCKDGVYEIRLSIKKKFNQVKKEIPLLGTLHNQIVIKDKAVFEGLSKEDFVKALQLLKGNKLIQKIEIRECYIDDSLVELVENMRTTTEISSENIHMRNNEIAIKSLNALVYNFPVENLNEVLMHNKITITEEKEDQNMLSSLKMKKMNRIVLKKAALERLHKLDIVEEFYRVIGNITNIIEYDLEMSDNIIKKDCLGDLTSKITSLNSLKKLSLSFADCGCFDDENFEALKDIMGLKNLEYLSLSFAICKKISDKGLHSVKEILLPLTSLHNLSLDFGYCSQISNDGLTAVRDVLEGLTSLHSLSLNFNGCGQISDNGLSSIKDSMTKLKTLQHLSLEFGSCPQISDKGFVSIREAIRLLRSLNHLSLHFGPSIKISDTQMNDLKDTLKCLTSLYYLSLDLKCTSNISSNGMNSLTEGLMALTSLKHLSLNFGEKWLNSANGLNIMKDAFKTLTSLRHLALHFEECMHISDSGLKSLRDSFRQLTFLQYLSLNFNGCAQISDNGLKVLRDALKPLIYLQNLYLYFEDCKQISGTGVSALKEAIKEIISLQQLSLSFNWCSISDHGLYSINNAIKSHALLQNLSLNLGKSDISSEGLNSLKDALIMLTSLQHLSLDFRWNKQVTDDGVDRLKEALICLKSLQYLSIDFGSCSMISDNGLNSLREAIKMLKSLEHLSLSFDGCQRISDNGLNILKEALEPLTSLQNLSISLNKCQQISDDGLRSLRDTLKSLKSLQHLSLHLGSCNLISDEGLIILKEALILFEYLQSLSLNFNDCPQISVSGLRNLVEELNLVSSLQRLALDSISFNALQALYLNFLICSSVNKSYEGSYKSK